MGTIYIKKRKCPFCGSKLEYGNVSCPDNQEIPLLECKTCHVYFYRKYWYDKLLNLAKDCNRRLNRDVYMYEEVQTKEKAVLEKKKNKKKLQNKSTKITKKKNKGKYMSDLPTEKVTSPKKIIDKDIKSCNYYKKDYCIYNDDKCKPYSVRCKLTISNSKLIGNAKKNSERLYLSKSVMPERFVTAIVLNYNKKCVYGEHGVEFVIGVCKIARINGTVGEIKIPASYCPICNKYFVYKNDFVKAKAKGVLLCEVEDKTSQYLEKHKFVYSGAESKVHALGYNVSKQSNYTHNQRKIILANIIENYGITRMEIINIIDVNTARHKNQQNYAEAISKWKQDREFVVNYKRGDCPEVIISKVELRYSKS